MPDLASAINAPPENESLPVASNFPSREKASALPGLSNGYSGLILEAVGSIMASLDILAAAAPPLRTTAIRTGSWLIATPTATLLSKRNS